MKKTRIVTLLLAAVFLALTTQPATGTATAMPSAGDVPVADLPLCQPGLYLVEPGDCLPLGPSQTILALNAEGFPYPRRELAAASPDPQLSTLPARVARVTGAATPVYASLSDAIGGGPPLRTIPDGASRYVSMIESAESGGRTFVRMLSGEWVEATPFYGYPKWQGLEFFDTPQTDLGWTVNPTPSYTGPGFSYPETGKNFDKYVPFQIFYVTDAEGYHWYEVGPDEWIPSLKARMVTIDTTTPPGVEGDRWINIDLYNQTLSVYENNELVFATVVATGSGDLYSDPGTYQIYQKIELDVMQGSYTSDRSDFYYLENVPWAMYYNHAQALHGIYWPALLGFTQSHGCVNMFPGDAHWLYDWAELGDYVYVHDPSGQTPIPTPTPMGTPPQPFITPTPRP